MGLAERRAIKNFEDNHWSALQTQIHEATGTAIPIEVDWASLAAPDYAHLYDEELPKIYFIPIIEAFKKVTFDDMGKEAVKSGISKIIVQNKKPDYSSYWAELENKVLTLDYQFTNSGQIDDRVEVLVKKLEEKL
jgi:hypothetical protein